MEIGEIRKIKIYPEICCDICMEVVHNHLDCPVCGEHTDSDNYYALYERPNKPLVCECGAEFLAVDTKGCEDEWKWRRIK